MIDFRALTVCEAEAARTLFFQVFGHEAEPAWWVWKYQGSGLEDALHWGAFDEQGALLAHVGALVYRPSPLSMRGSGVFERGPRYLIQVCDVMVAAQHRGWQAEGLLYRKLMASFAKALASRWPDSLAFGFPGPRPHRLGERLGLYRAFGHYRQLDSFSFGQGNLAKLSQGLSLRACAWDEALASVAHFAENKAAQSSEWAAPMIWRDATYLAWRYRDHPRHRYQAWLVTAKRWFRTQVVGWLVSRALAQGPPLLVDGYVTGYGLLTALLALGQHHVPSPDAMQAKAFADEAQKRSTPLDQGLWQAWMPGPGELGDVQMVATQFLYPSQWQGFTSDQERANVIFTPGDTDVW